jgi:glutamate-1-semialdehyde 2,1-aminomutase
VTNEDLFAAAQKVIPGGVNSPVRAFKKVGGVPRFIQRGDGAFLTDAQGKRYIDFVLSWGPLILGHCHPAVVEAVRRQAGLGMSYGAPTDLETKMAELVCSAFDSIEKVRFVSSGTEAAMSAIRLARAVTNRQLIVKFEGCYHGHADSLLVRAGSGLLTLGIPDSAGVPDAVASATAVLPYNDTEALEKFMKNHGGEVAALIVEPVAGNMGMVLPGKGFLETIRTLSCACGALLIFDEVITGFRFSFGGYQKIAGITPDLTCLGKIIGGGLPAAAFGGRADIMDLLSPVGPVYQAGTLSGNPLAMAAGIATLETLRGLAPYEKLGQAMTAFTSGLEGQAGKAGIPLTINRLGPMAGMFFHEGPVETFEAVMAADAARYAQFFHAMLEEGVYLAPSAYESLFVSTSHTAEVIEQALRASQKAFARLQTAVRP